MPSLVEVSLTVAEMPRSKREWWHRTGHGFLRLSKAEEIPRPPLSSPRANQPFCPHPCTETSQKLDSPRIRSPGSKHFGSHPHALHAHGHRNCPIPGRCGPPENPRGHAFPGGSTVGTGRECARAGASCWGRGPPAAGNWSRLRAVHPAVFCAWCLCGAGSSASTVWGSLRLGAGGEEPSKTRGQRPLGM
jgi:hypothetical protein